MTGGTRVMLQVIAGIYGETRSNGCVMAAGAVRCKGHAVRGYVIDGVRTGVGVMTGLAVSTAAGTSRGVGYEAQIGRTGMTGRTIVMLQVVASIREDRIGNRG